MFHNAVYFLPLFDTVLSMWSKGKIFFASLGVVVIVVLLQLLANVFTLLLIDRKKQEVCFDTLKTFVDDHASCRVGQTLSYVRDIDGKKILICRCNSNDSPPAVLPNISLTFDKSQELYNDFGIDDIDDIDDTTTL